MPYLYRVVLAVTAVGMLTAGCQPTQTADTPELTQPLPTEFLKLDWTTQEVPEAHIIRRDYRLREGDLLEIIYHIRHQKKLDYKIKIQDVISIRFPFNPSLTQVEQVQSDGTLHLDLVGTVYVFDRTITQVQDELEQLYAQYLKNPVLTVGFKQSNVKITELKEAIKTAPRGQSRLVPVTPDGTISLPFIVNVEAAGKTVGELHRELNAAYLELGLEELEVTVNIQTVSPMQIYVMGEVRRPGLMSGSNDRTLLQAIAHAGGLRPPRADLSKVMLVRRRHLSRPQAAIVNVHQLLENRMKAIGQSVVADSSEYRHDIWLQHGDIVYVPTTEIAKRADYIEYVWTRGIRAVLGFTSSAQYNATDTVDWLGPNH